MDDIEDGLMWLGLANGVAGVFCQMMEYVYEIDLPMTVLKVAIAGEMGLAALILFGFSIVSLIVGVRKVKSGN